MPSALRGFLALIGLIRKLIIGVSVLAATFSFAGFVVKGLVPLYQAKKEYDIKVREVSLLRKENARLFEETHRLKHDSAYLEQVLRENYGFVRQNETFYQPGGRALKGNR
jgi:cell division protein FtsB